MVYKTYYNSPIGNITLASDGENLIGLWIEGQKYFQGSIKEELVLKDDLEIFRKTKHWLDRYFNKDKPNISELLILPMGTEFNKRVWKILCNIPYGGTITYGEISQKIAKEMNLESMSAQAVGNAVGHNPISIIIPCHRVVGKGGNLTGYAGGIDKKVKLLELEGVDTRNMFMPKEKKIKK